MFADSELPQIGNNNNISAKRSSRIEDRSLGLSEPFAILPKKDSSPASKKTSPSILTESMVSYRSSVRLCNGPISPLAKGTGCDGKSASDCSPKSSACALPYHRFAYGPMLMLSPRSETPFEPPFEPPFNYKWCRRPETTCSISTRCNYCKTFIDTV